MRSEMRQALARESFEEKVRKVGQLIRLVKAFPHRPAGSKQSAAVEPAATIHETQPPYKGRRRKR